MDNVIGLVNRIQRACTVLGDCGSEGAVGSLWEALPSVAVVGGQSSFIFPGLKGITDFAAVRKEISNETDRIKQISVIPIHLSVYSPNVVSLTRIDLLGLTKIAVDGQSNDTMPDIENIVRSYIEKLLTSNSIILAVYPANQDIATSDAIKIAREVNPYGERTFSVLMKLDLMDKGTNALNVLEGRSYHLQHQWVGVVNLSQQDINKNVDMIAAKRREREHFVSSHEYGHLVSKMG